MDNMDWLMAWDRCDKCSGQLMSSSMAWLVTLQSYHSHVFLRHARLNNQAILKYLGTRPHGGKLYPVVSYLIFSFVWKPPTTRKYRTELSFMCSCAWTDKYTQNDVKVTALVSILINIVSFVLTAVNFWERKCVSSIGDNAFQVTRVA